MKRKALSIFCTAAIVCVLLLGGAVGVLADDISSASDLAKMEGQSGEFTLTKDIELDNTFKPITNFSGTLNGNGKAIKNLSGAGLFESLNNATIKNLTLTGCKVESGDENVGALAAIATSTTITNCSVAGTVTGTATDRKVGGLIGLGTGVTISQCWSSATVKAENTGCSVGGLVGATEDGGSIDNSYNSGAVTGNANDANSFAGGLIGTMDGDGKISNSYSNGKVAAKTAGALVGNADGTFSNSFFLANGSQKFYGAYPTGDTAPAGATSVTEDKLKSGEVAYSLQGSQSTQIWGQVLSGGNVDVVPVLTSTAAEKVLKATIKDKADKELGVDYFNSGTAPDFASFNKSNMTFKVFSDKDMKNAVDEKATYTADTIFYGKYVCTVTYETNGGSSITAATVDQGSKLTAPTAPTKSGYTFDAWYKDKDLKTKWNFSSDTVTENITLYAKWNSSGTAATNDSTTNNSNSNPKAGDEGIPTMYYVLFILALAALCTSLGLFVRAKRKN